MVRYSLCFLFASLLFSTAPAAEPNTDWMDGWLSWITEWFYPAGARQEDFSSAEAPTTVAVPALPLIQPRETLPIAEGWPYAGSDVTDALDRRRRLLEQSVLVADPARRLPLAASVPLRVVYQEGRIPQRLLNMVRRFGDVQEVSFATRLSPAFTATPDAPLLVVVEHPPGQPASLPWYQALSQLEDVILLHFGNWQQLAPVPASWTVLQCPLRSKESEAFMAQALYGAQGLTATLRQANEQYGAGTGEVLLATHGGFRDPELLGIDRRQLALVDRDINAAIRQKATPGAQLAVYKGGQLVYERAYGKHTYSGDAIVSPGDLYDLASITKAAATTLAVMKLYDEGRLTLSARVRDYLPEYARLPVGDYRMDALLSHHTGAQSRLPLDGLLPRITPSSAQVGATLAISDTRSIDHAAAGDLATALGTIDHTRQPIHRYSDVNFVLLQYVIERVSGMSLQDYVAQEFYEPMGLRRLMYRPRERFDREQLVPSAYDRWLGRGQLQGYVHDEGAAVMGGVAGHAGLFGNAADVGRLFQLLNDGGRFGDRQLISAATVRLFCSANPYNKRGLGFDRLRKGYRSVLAAGASPATVGHTGFTGTSVWADAEHDLVVVLLTNRTYPDHSNKKLQRLGTRNRVLRGVYRALDTYSPEGDVDAGGVVALR